MPVRHRNEKLVSLGDDDYGYGVVFDLDLIEAASKHCFAFLQN